MIPLSATPWVLMPHAKIDHPVIFSAGDGFLAKVLRELKWLTFDDCQKELDMHIEFKKALPNNVPGVVGLFAGNEPNTWVYIQQDIVGETLVEHVGRVGRLPEQIIIQILDIFLILNAHELEHGDTHGFNFIVDDNDRVWVIDFGSSRKTSQTRDQVLEINTKELNGGHLILDLKTGKVYPGSNLQNVHPRLDRYLRLKQDKKIKTYAHYNNIKF